VLNIEKLKDKPNQERYRVGNAAILELRKEHGFFIKADRKLIAGGDRDGGEDEQPPKTAPALALEYAIDRASGGWLKDVYYSSFYLSVDELARFEVLIWTQDRYELNTEMFCTKETYDRTFLAQRSKSQLLWHGGVYATAALASETDSVKNKEKQRLLDLHPRLIAAEEAAAQRGAHKYLIEFMHEYLWGASQIYRLIMLLVVEGELAAALFLVLLIHKNIRHTKGMEDIFNALRKLVRYGSQNNILSINRIWCAIRRAANRTFPNVKQVAVGPADWENPCFFTKKAMQQRMQHVRIGDGAILEAKEFEASSVKCTAIKPNPADKNRRTMTSDMHSGMVGLEFCIKSLKA